MYELGGRLEAMQRVYRLTLTPEVPGLLSSGPNSKKKNIGSTGNTGYNRRENAKLKIAEMNIKTNDKKNRDKIRKENSLLSNSDGAKVRVTLEEMHGGGDYQFGSGRDVDGDGVQNKEIINLEKTMLTSTSNSISTSTPLNTFSKTSKSSLKNDLRELQGDLLRRSTSLLTENGGEDENDSRIDVWARKEVRDDRDHNDVKEIGSVEGVRGRIGAPVGVTGDSLGSVSLSATGAGVSVGGGTGSGVRTGTGTGAGRVEVQSIVQTQPNDEGQGQDKAGGKGNLISYIRMTAFDRIGSKVLVNILDDQVRTYVRSSVTAHVLLLCLLSINLRVFVNDEYDAICSVLFMVWHVCCTYSTDTPAARHVF